MTLLGSIRVLLALDGLAGDLVERRLRSDAEFEVVGRPPADDALRAARQAQPDFVVIPFHRTPVELLEAVPHMRVLGLELQNGRAYLTELLSDVSPDDLVEALRRAATRRTH